MPKRKKDDCPASSRKKIIPQKDEPNPIVRLNVGGVRYEVARDTLMRYEESMLASLISGKWKEGDGEDEIFIDRDGGRFKYILDYLRSDRVYVADASDQAALEDEFDYFGRNEDIGKVSVMDDFTAIHELGKEIKQQEADIAQKKKKIAVMKESYRLANAFSRLADTNERNYWQLNIDKDVDKELLRGCLKSRGLHVVSYTNKDADSTQVNVCVNGMKEIYDPKLKKNNDP